MLADRVGFTEAKGEKSKIFVFQQGLIAWKPSGEKEVNHILTYCPRVTSNIIVICILYLRAEMVLTNKNRS